MTSHNEQDMDAKQLASLTADAVSNVLFFHTKKVTPPTVILHSGLALAIDAIFHLRSRAADLAVAHLEIACDAALSYANDYNELHPDNTISPRWMYICVQALLSHHLIPSLVKDSRKVERLVDWDNAQPKTLKVQEERERSSFCDPGLDDDDDDDGPRSCSIEVPTTPSRHESMELDIADDDDEDEDNGEDDEASDGLLRARGGVIKTTKTPWAEEDVRFLIELRAMGMTHSQTADYLNRGKGAVENKYGRVVNDTAWKSYVNECKARYSKFRRDKGRRKLPPSDFHYTDEDREQDDGLESMRRRAVKRQRESTLAAAAAATAAVLD